jgi:hypothetical protein
VLFLRADRNASGGGVLGRTILGRTTRFGLCVSLRFQDDGMRL